MTESRERTAVGVQYPPRYRGGRALANEQTHEARGASESESESRGWGRERAGARRSRSIPTSVGRRIYLPEHVERVRVFRGVGELPDKLVIDGNRQRIKDLALVAVVLMSCKSTKIMTLLRPYGFR